MHRVLWSAVTNKKDIVRIKHNSCQWLKVSLRTSITNTTIIKNFIFHIWRYSPFRALASLIRRLHSSLFSAPSSTLLSPAVVMHPSGPHPPICFLVFTLVLWCRSFRLKLSLESFLFPFLLCPCSYDKSNFKMNASIEQWWNGKTLFEFNFVITNLTLIGLVLNPGRSWTWWS